MKKLYIFKVGQTFENTHNHLGDFVDWINNFNDDKTVQIETIDILQGDDLPSLNETKGVIITGSHSMVTDNLPWSIKTEQWIQEASHVKIPILGICYGHQLIDKALGGKVEDNLNGKEIGTVKIYTSSEIKKDRLFSDAPLTFEAHVTHMQSVLTLPKGATTLAFNEHDMNQVVRFSDSVWGVQFHPEFDEAIMKAYIKEQEKELISYGMNTKKLLNDVHNTAYSNQLISQFIKMIHTSKQL